MEVGTRLAGGALGNLASPGSAILGRCASFVWIKIFNMKNIIFTKKPFYENHEFVGEISSDDMAINNLQIFLQCPLTTSSAIEGIIIGSKEKFDELFELCKTKQSFFTLRSNDEFTNYESSRVSIKQLKQPTYQTIKSTINKTYDLALISLDELKINNKSPESNNNVFKNIRYFILGPIDVWDVMEIGSLAYDGNNQIKITNSSFVLSNKFPFDIEITPYHFYDNDSENNNYMLSTSIMSFNFKMKDKQSITESEFIDLTESTLEIILTLASFISKTRINWFRSDYNDENKSLFFIKNISKPHKSKIDFNDYFIEPRFKREFFKIAFSNYIKLKNDDFDLFMTIIYFISSFESQYLEEKFTNLFLSLENVKDLYANKYSFKSILKNEEFDAIYSKIKKSLKEIYKDYLSEQRDMLYEKIGELNRPSLNRVLNIILKKYSINIDDLYPANTKISLIETRNDLFHTSIDIPIEILSKETIRLEILLERIILALLGWPELSRTINKNIHSFLTK